LTDGVRFVHAADLHLDAPFAGVGADDQRVGAALAEATFVAFDRVIEVCLDRGARFLVLSGDAYNSADSSLRAQLHFRAGMQRLADAGIEVFVVHGNHDPASGWSAGLPLPDSVHVFPTDRVGRFEVEVDGDVVAAVYGRSFARAAELENFASGYTRQPGDPVAVGVLHANIGSNAGYDPYAPATLDDLRAARMDYWALGHIHKQETLSRDPWVVYPGSTQGLNPKETGAHGCMVVDVGPGGITGVEAVETAPIGWAQIDCDVSVADSIEAVTGILGEACNAIRTGQDRPVVARITLSGRSAVHSELGRPGLLADLAQNVRQDQSLGNPWVWLDRLTDSTSPVLDLDAVRAGGEFSAELVKIADELSADPGELDALIAEITAPVATSLPDYRPGTDPAALLERARDAALDLLLASDGERS
jgi:DNA repair exonuclease SbcCD nuclease subunit